MKRSFRVDRFLVQRMGISLIALAAFLTVVPIIGVFGYIIAKGAPAI
jgi:hypothetical protein